jgi:hypothetical protein
LNGGLFLGFAVVVEEEEMSDERLEGLLCLSLSEPATAV